MTPDKLYPSLTAMPSWLNRPNHFQRTRLHLTLRMTSAQVVDASVTNNSSFQNYPHPDDHKIRITDTPGFKPLTMLSVALSRTFLKASYDLP